MHPLELKIPPVLLVALTAFAMWGLAVAVPIAAFQLPWTPALATALGGLGLTVSLLGVLAFRRASTTVDPRTPHQATRLVSGGIYRCSRNPMYLGLLVMLLGWAVCLSHGPAFLLLPAFVWYMNRFQIAPEERAMLAKFGSDYRAYMVEVSRWL